MKNKTEKGKRSPLERKPLHNPGESIQQDMERLLYDQAMPIAMAIGTAVAFAVVEWLRWLFKLPPQLPIVITVVAVVVIGYGLFRIPRLAKQYKALRLGMNGEKFVGQYLEDLRSQGCRVFHDIVGNRFNIDHVVVSPHGIFVIETKTYSKPVRGKPVVEFDGERILVNGFEPERNAVTQARALGDWLRNLLEESTGQKFPIRCAVVLPGWFVEPWSKDKGDVWVLSHKALPTFIEHEPIRLKSEDIALISSRLIIHMQTAW